MYSNNNRYRILQLFFDDPHKRFQLREVERKTKIAIPSVRNHVRALEKGGFLERLKEGIYPSYTLKDSKKVQTYKRNDLLARLWESGLLNEIERKCRPDCIVLYGSAVEGRDDKRGDIDLFIQSKEKNIDLTRYEKELNRKISLLFEPNLKKLKKEFLNSLVNGIILQGFLKVV